MDRIKLKDMNRKRKIILIAGSAAVLLVILLLIVRTDRRQHVELGKVSLGNISASVSASGTVQAATEVQISASVPGTIEKLAVSEGQAVKKNEVLAQLDQQEYRANLTRAEASLQLTQAALAQSKTMYSRAKELFNKHLISRQDYESAQTQYLLDEARVKEASAVVKQAKKQLDDTIITSPMDGVVTQLKVEVGEQVVIGLPSVPGVVLMVIADMSRMRVEGEVSEVDVVSIQPGQKAFITVEAFIDSVFEGEVTEVAMSPINAGAGGVVNFLVKVSLDDSVPNLLPGMTAFADIITASHDSVLVVPIQSVLTKTVSKISPQYRPKDIAPQTEVQAVFIVEHGTAYLVPVTAGIAGRDYLEITSGLRLGEVVITGPFAVLQSLRGGTAVKG
ncbi:MAG: efflux RND transporter periplasmic adaptor subunit [Chitinispirillales bacterium]|nr:efflux RND transporter periplasmic adaptor subunit [Chitinispirillales bacterium]